MSQLPAPTQQNPTEPNTFCKNTSPSSHQLTSRQQTAISLLTSGHTITAVAATLGLNRCTIHQWKQLPAFISELTTRQEEIRIASDARIRRLLLQASQTALDSLSSKREDRHRNAFRVLSVIRPFIPLMNQPLPLQNTSEQDKITFP